MSTFQSQQEQFYNNIQFERRLSKHTLISYKTDLTQFQEFLETTFRYTNYSQAEYNEIRTWIVFLKDKNLSNRSINRKISALKSMYKHLLVKEEVERNPMLKIISPKQSKKLPVYFEQKILEKLFETENFTKDFKGFRDLLILELLYGTGMRLSELIHIKEQDIVGKEVKVLGKGNKERLIPLTENLIILIGGYKKIKNEEFEQSGNYLLVTNKGKKMYEKFVYRTVNSYLSKVTNEKKKSPHTMRHSFATNMLNNGAKLHTIKEMLGHASLSATQVYTHNSIERLKETYKKFHPK